MLSKTYKYELAFVSGPIIKKLRRERKMTQEELANIMNVSRSVVGNWEASLRAPTTEQYCELAALFDVKTDYLVGKDSAKKFINVPEDEYFDMKKLNEEGKNVLFLMYNALVKNPRYASNEGLIKK